MHSSRVEDDFYKHSFFFPCPLTQPVTCRAQREESDVQTAAGRVGPGFPPPSLDSHSFRRNELQDFSKTAAAAAAARKVADLLRHKNKESSHWEHLRFNVAGPLASLIHATVTSTTAPQFSITSGGGRGEERNKTKNKETKTVNVQNEYGLEKEENKIDEYWRQRRR